MKPKILCDENLSQLKKIKDESIDLVYIDPPYNTNVHQGDYDDRWKSMDDYLNFLKPRVQEMHRILKPTGSIYIQSNRNANSYIRVLVDSIFGNKNYLNEIVWNKRCPKNLIGKSFSDDNEFILFYRKTDKNVFHQQFKPLSKTTLKQYKHDDNDGKGLYQLSTIHAINGKKFDLGFGERTPVSGYRYSKEKILDLHRQGRVVFEKGKIPKIKVYLKDSKGTPMSSLWDDIGVIKRAISKEHTNYATQKPEKLLQRIINTSSNPGDTVLDAFAGSGTTCAVANKLGRKSVCIDMNPKACQIMKNRLN